MNWTHDIFVCGGGAFGSTLASILADNGKRVLLWVRSQEQAKEIAEKHTNTRYLDSFFLSRNLKVTTDIKLGVCSAPVVLMAIPTQSLRQVTRDVGAYLHGDQILVHAVKGLELGSHKRPSEILREETCARKIGVISGPNLAKEMIQGAPSGAIIASRYLEVCQVFQNLYQGSILRLYSGDDIIGTELSGAFKNIIAFMVGIVHGLGFKDNTKALLITRGLNEMMRFGIACGGKAETFSGLAGVGDLMATCYSPFSRNRSVGERVGKGEHWQKVVESLNSVVEGISTTKAVYELSQEISLDLPIVTALYQVLYADVTIEEVKKLLMSLPVGEEYSRSKPLGL